MLHFRRWLEARLIAENDFRTGAKIGLYPDIADALGQYPPLYGTPKASDLQTYVYYQYGPAGVPELGPGMVDYADTNRGSSPEEPWWVREMRRRGLKPSYVTHDHTKWPWRLPDEPGKRWHWSRDHERLK